MTEFERALEAYSYTLPASSYQPPPPRPPTDEERRAAEEERRIFNEQFRSRPKPVDTGVRTGTINFQEVLRLHAQIVQATQEPAQAAHGPETTPLVISQPDTVREKQHTGLQTAGEMRADGMAAGTTESRGAGARGKGAAAGGAEVPSAQGGSCAIRCSETPTLTAETGQSGASRPNSTVSNSRTGDTTLTRYMRLSPRQMRLIRSVLGGLATPSPVATRDFFLHLLYCQSQASKRYAVEGVPVPHYKIQALPDAPWRTDFVWRSLQHTGLITVLEYEEGVCRRFLVSPAFLVAFTEAGEEDRKEGVKLRFDPFVYTGDLLAGKRTRARYRTELTYDGVNSWDKRSNLVYRVLKYYRSSRALVNLPVYSAFVEALKKAAEKARRAALAAPGDRDARKSAQAAEARWAHEERILQSILDQCPTPALDMPEGIYQYTPAYEVQEISGRLSMKGGGAQNASRAGKAAMYAGIPNLHNWDIKSSQSAKLIEEFEDAILAGADLDITVLTGYAGKDALAAQHGVSRDVFKRAEHSPKFGAGFTHNTFESAWNSARREATITRQKGNTYDMTFDEHVRSRLHTMPRIALEIAEDVNVPEINDPGAAYELLVKVYRPMSKEITKWRAWLVEEHWKAHSRSGGRGRGRYIENPCGLAFSIYNYDARERGIKYATSLLQGGEAAFIHHLTLLGLKYGYEVIGNEHDGLLTIGIIPDEAVIEARDLSGFRTAEIEDKPFLKTCEVRKCEFTQNTEGKATPPTDSSVLAASAAPQDTGKTDSSPSSSSTKCSSCSALDTTSTPASPTGSKVSTSTRMKPSVTHGAARRTECPPKTSSVLGAETPPILPSPLPA